MTQVQTHPAEARSRVAWLVVAVLTIVVIPTAAQLSLGAQLRPMRDDRPGAAFAAVAGVALVAILSWRLNAWASRRAPSGDRHWPVVTRFRLTLVWTYIGATTGMVMMYNGARPPIRDGRVPLRPSELVSPGLIWGGTTILAVTLLFLVVRLAASPSTRSEFGRLIDLEASAMTLGVFLLVTYSYRGFEAAFGWPAYGEGTAYILLMGAYAVSKVALALKYR